MNPRRYQDKQLEEFANLVLFRIAARLDPLDGDRVGPDLRRTVTGMGSEDLSRFLVLIARAAKNNPK